MHLSDDQLLESLDEANRSGDHPVSIHLETCHGCLARRAELARQWEWTVARLSTLAAGGEPPDASRLMARASRTATRRFPFRIAAGVAFLITAGTVSAMPASPLRGWVESKLDHRRSNEPGAVEPRSPSSRSGLALTPAVPFSVRIAGQALRGGLTVELADGGIARLEAMGSTASFSVEAGNVLVTPAADFLELLVVVPIDLPELAIYVGGRRILSRVDGRWTPSLDVAVVGDRERVSLGVEGG